MSIPQFDVKNEYIGANNLADYSFDFKIKSLDQIRIRVWDDLFNKVQDVDGNDLTYLSSVDFDPIGGGGIVHLQANLPTDYKIAILLELDEPTQLAQFQNKGDFTLKSIENALDTVLQAVQRAIYLSKRSIKTSDALADSEDFDTTIPVNSTNTLVQDNRDKIIAIGDDNKSIKLGPTTASIFSSANIAVAAAAAALVSEGNALASANAAALSAAASAADALASAASAAASAASAAAALVSEGNAFTSETNAAASAAAAAADAAAAAASIATTAANAAAAAASAAAANADAAAAALSAANAAASEASVAADAAAAAASAAASAASAAAALVSENNAAASAAAAALSAATIPAVTKYTFTYADFGFPALQNGTGIFLLAKQYINWMIIKHTTPFAGGLIASYTISAGFLTDIEYYMDAFDVFQPVSDTTFKEATLGADVQDFGTAVGVRFTATSTGDNLDQATQGQVDIYVMKGTLP